MSQDIKKTRNHENPNDPPDAFRTFWRQTVQDSIKILCTLSIFFVFVFTATSDQKIIRETPFDVTRTPSYAPWFDGVIFHKNLFLNHYRKKGLHDQQIYEIYQYLERIGPHILFAQPPFLTPSERKALIFKQQWTHSLIDVSSDEGWTKWKQDFHSSINHYTQNLSRRERQIFYVYLGMDVANPLSFQNTPDLHSYMSQSIGSKRAKAELPTTHDTGFYSAVHQAFGDFQGLYVKGQSGSQPTYDQAMLMMRTNLRNAGLMGVRLPLGAIKNVQDVEDFSRKIASYNQTLEKRTGWSKAMGVKGRTIWFVDHTSTVNAYTLPLDHDVFLIYGPWSSYAHEWFHVLTHAFKQQHPNVDVYKHSALPYTHLRQAIQYKGLTTSQWKSLMTEAQQNSYSFFQPKWHALSFPQPWDKPEELMSFSKDQISSSYNAAIASTYVYWLKKPGANTKVSSFVARRMLADRMLQEAKWSEPGLVEAGYFVLPDEWLASSFQGDMSYRVDGYRSPQISFIQTPLQTEILAYQKDWDLFFDRMTPWWDGLSSNT